MRRSLQVRLLALNRKAMQRPPTDRWRAEGYWKSLGFEAVLAGTCEGTGISLRDYRGPFRKGAAMMLASIAFATILIFSVAHAQSGVPSGRGSTSGDPAASSATPEAR